MTQLAHETLAFANSDASRDRVNLVPTADDQRDGAGAPAAQDGAAHRYLLVLRFAVFNLAAFALLGAAYLRRPATGRSAIPTRAGESSTCCATISGDPATRPG